LKTQTFEALPPQALLIGSKDLTGFAANAEAKIDAGACMSLEAWAPKSASSTFWGLGMNLCDVDGTQQYLELVTYHPPTNTQTNVSSKQIGWVHIGFTQPTHLKIVRDPNNLGKFDVSYRPDNRADFATPFAPVLEPGLTSLMEAGVSMNSGEAYRYAEFYNVSIEECPTSCNAASGKQVYCGNITTACGTILECPAACGASSGEVCRDEMCMACPSLGSTYDNWDCGKVDSICTNPLGQKVQLKLDVGTPAPTLQHTCENNKWVCRDKSKWAFLAEGKQCGDILGQCGVNVTLFPCKYPNDKCESHTCNCYPSTFPVNFNCGTKGNGCGNDVVFGSLSGGCPAGDRCTANTCCTPKTLADFPTYQCGNIDDTCGAVLEFYQSDPAVYMTKPPGGSAYSYGTGQIGFEFQTKSEKIKIAKLARGLQPGKGSLQVKSTVSLWKLSTKTKIASIDIGPGSTVKGSYAWVQLAQPVELEKNTKYRLVQKMWSGMKDKWSNHWLYGSNRNDRLDQTWVTFKGQVKSSNQEGYPEDSHISNYYGIGIVNFAVIENDGCGRGNFKCNHTTHSCEAGPVANFTISGPCKSDGLCVTSPNYPSQYSKSQHCSITVPSGTMLTATAFQTESGYDKLMVNGKRYQGSSGPKSVTVTAGISWTSDFIVQKKGWKLCQGDGGASANLVQTEEDSDTELEETREEAEKAEQEEYQSALEADAQEQAKQIALQAAEEAGTLDEALEAMMKED
jgi:hypothetical protein